MKPTDLVVLIGATLATAAPLAAQAASACVGPGAAFGVTAYQCASCGFKRENGRTTYSFNAEPVVMETTAGSALRPGDVIEAVAGKPITTSEGATAFTYPNEAPGLVVAVPTGPLIVVDGVVQGAAQPGPSRRGLTVTVRRDGRSLTLTVLLTERCGGGGRGQRLLARDTARTGAAGRPTTDSATRPSSGPTTGTTSRFGFALACEPSCTRVRVRNGTEYWRFDSHPPIVALRPDGPAERAGLRIGDRVTEVDGKSILTEEGTLRFLRDDAKDSIHLIVLRDGMKLSIPLTLATPRPPD